MGVPIGLIVKIMGDQNRFLPLFPFPGIRPIVIRPANAVAGFDFRVGQQHFHRFFQEQMAVEPIMIKAETIDPVFPGYLALPAKGFHLT